MMATKLFVEDDKQEKKKKKKKKKRRHNKHNSSSKHNNYDLPSQRLQLYWKSSVSDEPDDRYALVAFPPKLCSLGLRYMGKDEMPMVFPFANSLKKLDLLCAVLNTEEHCQLVQLCPNLELLQARSVIGDIGLEALVQHCKKLRRLRIGRVEVEDEDEDIKDEQGVVSHRGLSALAQGCVDLEYLALYVSDINNTITFHVLQKLFCHFDFRDVLLNGVLYWSTSSPVTTNDSLCYDIEKDLVWTLKFPKMPVECVRRQLHYFGVCGGGLRLIERSSN